MDALVNLIAGMMAKTQAKVGGIDWSKADPGVQERMSQMQAAQDLKATLPAQGGTNPSGAPAAADGEMSLLEYLFKGGAERRRQDILKQAPGYGVGK